MSLMLNLGRSHECERSTHECVRHLHIIEKLAEFNATWESCNNGELGSMDKVAAGETHSFASSQADKRLGRLAFEVNHALKSRDAEAVHDLRVALRRFSQALRVFKPCFRGKEFRKIRREAKRTLSLAGEVRNCDIALQLLAKSKQAQKADLPLQIEARRHEAERTLVAALRRWTDRKSSRRWRVVLETAAVKASHPSGKASIARTAQQTLPRLAEEFFERGDRAAREKASPAELHQFRIVSKKFRYSLELFLPLYGPAMKPALEKIKQVQGLLGDINDCETVRGMISQYKGIGGVAAWLRRKQRKRIEEFQKCWLETLGTEAELRGWRAFLSRPTTKTRAVKKPAARVAGPEPLRTRAAVA
ncbi:MAG TPA: CHAD domain-containing protein [Bryobacteraceae bacterium]|nr:CHAD domain-containing protein [Bryobacteraceae bacterium]